MGKGNIIHINKMFNTIEIYNNRLYIAGVILDNKERKKIAQTFTEYDNYKGSIPFDLNILSFSKDGDKISEFSHTINENQYKNAKIYDILIKENKIHLVGEISSYKQFLSMYLVLNLNGELEEKRIFVDPKSSENRLIKILETSNNNILLLGKGKGWRIMKI